MKKYGNSAIYLFEFCSLSLMTVLHILFAVVHE